MKKMITILLVIFVVFAMIITGSYLYFRYMPDKNIARESVDYSFTAQNLAKEYEKNPVGSDNKFIDRIIEVTGVISEISTDQNNSVVFILRDKESTIGVLCTLNAKSTKKASRFKIGDDVKVRGACSGMLFEVVLNKCVIVDK